MCAGATQAARHITTRNDAPRASAAERALSHVHRREQFSPALVGRNDDLLRCAQRRDVFSRYDCIAVCMTNAPLPSTAPPAEVPVALVIEADPATRHLLIRALQSLGVRAIGDAALAWTELNRTPDLVTV